jgi:hypothetical protein
MRLLILASAALALLTTSPAATRDWTKEESLAGLQKYEFTRFVPSGVERMISFMYSLKQDCSSQGDIIVRKITEPNHGTVQIVPGEGQSTIKADSKMAKCNDKPVPGVLVNYQSAGEYVGPDSFKLLFLYPNGLAQEALYKIVVR